VVTRRQGYRVDIRHEGGGKDPDRCSRAAGGLDFLEDWLSEVGSHESGDASILSDRHVTTYTIQYNIRLTEVVRTQLNKKNMHVRRTISKNICTIV